MIQQRNICSMYYFISIVTCGIYGYLIGLSFFLMIPISINAENATFRRSCFCFKPDYL